MFVGEVRWRVGSVLFVRQDGEYTRAKIIQTPEERSQGIITLNRRVFGS